MQQIIIVTGPPGAGKTSVSLAICERFDRMMHVPVDDLRHMMRAGYRHPWLDEPQAREQLRLAVANASSIARNAVAERYAVVIDDVVPPDAALAYAEALRGAEANVHLVTLLPSLDIALARDAARGPGVSIPDRVRVLHREFSEWIASGRQPGAHLDTSEDRDAQASADRVQDAITRGAALLLAAE